MTQKDKPAAWPESVTAAFAPFSGADTGNASSAGGNDANPFMQPFAQSFAGGVDFVKKLWGGLPGSGAVPGFMVPTMDVEELDKRIKDLRTVESWLAMNTNMLRATIQGLEVQRNTIAAIQSLGASMSEAAGTGRAPEHKAPPASGLPPGWPVGAPREHTLAEVEAGPAPAAEAAPHAEVELAPARSAKRQKQAAASTSQPASVLPGLSPANWLGYMQDQFSKVAEAALATPAIRTRMSPSGPKAKGALVKARTGRAAASRKKPAPRKT